MRRKETTMSRRATPWDGKPDLSPTEAYIKERHNKHYEDHHKSLKDDDEAWLLNSRIPESCRYCRSNRFVRYGHSKNGIQVYRCNDCGRRFTVLTGTIFDSHKIPISEWIEFLYNLFSFVSLNSGSWNNKNAITTSRYWLDKVFILVRAYQDSIVLKGKVILDETFYPMRSSDIITVNGKKLRGLSRNQICIGVACDDEHVFCVLEGNGKPSQKKTYEAFRNHIAKGSLLIHDKEKAHKKLMDELELKSEAYAADRIKKLTDSENPLERVNRIHFFLKRFFYAHSSFQREDIEGFVNLFSFVMNPPVEKLEKVGILLDLGLECTQILRYRDAFQRNRDVSEGF
ncbi:IS1 family transposase [Sphaerochaeta halotolerans]|jgi:transposase-like protein|uniref:IS1 family transposase n=1 Tax=Sphaerochaeta halotolerans TaxID=2293840 RepID=A0A372MGI8_9SPIR|nr:IS1 family transposase [Sphaerochaeta halotolerans]RFU94508.1 IS1 family transposase [Sphaerochaeta halotolerans]